MTGLKSIRKSRNLSQLQLADFVHESPSTVAMWETGTKHPHPGQVIKLCRVLECSPCDLYAITDREKAKTTVPLFDLLQGTKPQSVPIPDTASHRCHFAVVVPYPLSGRVQAGDICFFELTAKAKNGDIVITLEGSRYSICICDSNTANIAAVCRMLSVKM